MAKIAECTQVEKRLICRTFYQRKEKQVSRTRLCSIIREFVAPPKKDPSFSARRKRFFFPLPRLVVLGGGVHCSLSCRRCLHYSGLHLCSRLSLSTFLSPLSRSLGNQDSYCFHFKIESHPQSKRARKKRREAAQLRGFFLSLALIYLKAMTELKDFYQWP